MILPLVAALQQILGLCLVATTTSQPLHLGFVQSAAQSVGSFTARRGDVACEVSRGGLRLSDGSTGAAFLLGVERATSVAPESELPGRISFFHGCDPSRFRVDLPHYARVRIAGVARDVDLVIRVDDAGFEYDLEGDPGALATFELTLEDDVAASLDDGDLVMARGDLELRHSSPRAFALSADGARTPVPARFELRGEHRVGFVVTKRPGERLVIDPGLQFSTFLGSVAFDEARAIAIDSSNASVFCGATNATSFPVTSGAYDTSFGGTFSDAFVAKVAANGQLVFATFFGGAGIDVANAIAISADGKIHIAGKTQSIDLATSTTAFDKTANGGIDGFVAALAADGKSLVYSSYLGGSFDEEVTGIAVSPSNDVFVTGYTGSVDFPITPGAFDSVFNGGGSSLTDAFVARFAPLATALSFATFYGGTGIDEGHAIALASGDPVIVGRTESATLPLAALPFDSTYSGGNGDGFVARFSSDGATLNGATYVGGTILDSLDAIASNTSFGLFTAGFSRSLDVGIQLGPDLSPAGLDDGMLAVFDSAMTLQWGGYLGGALDDRALAVAVDPVGATFVVGRTASSNYPALQSSFDSTANGGIDAFFTKVRAGGLGYNESGYLGGAGYDEARGVAVAAGGVARIVGRTTSLDFPITAGAPQTTGKGSSDAFLSGLPTAICSNSPTASTYGSGKPGATGIPLLDTIGLPVVPSSSMILRISGALPGATPILFIGLSQIALPFDGGFLLVSPILSLTLPPIGSNGRLDIPTAFGEDPGLCGLHVDLQAMYFDPAAAGSYHTAQSKGLVLLFGS